MQIDTSIYSHFKTPIAYDIVIENTGDHLEIRIPLIAAKQFAEDLARVDSFLAKQVAYGRCDSLQRLFVGIMVGIRAHLSGRLPGRIYRLAFLPSETITRFIEDKK